MSDQSREFLNNEFIIFSKLSMFNCMAFERLAQLNLRVRWRNRRRLSTSAARTYQVHLASFRSIDHRIE